MTVLRRLLLDRRRGALWWAIGTVLGVATIVGLWPSVKGNNDIEDIVANLPSGVRAAFGMEDGISLSSAPGYLQGRLFSTVLPMILIIYAIGLGARAIGGAEEDGTMQLVLAAPVSRRRVAVERFLGSTMLVLAMLGVGLAATLGIGAAVGIFDDLSLGRVLIDIAALGELALLFMTITFTAGAVTGRRGPALAAGSGVAVASYVLHGIAASAEVTTPLRVLSPWWWFLDRNLLVHDPTFLAVGLPLVLSAAIFVYGVWAYERRDLRFP